MFYAKRKSGDIRNTFFGKCYICENDDILGDKEHRIPQNANKSDNNLQRETNIFWACRRCNRKKSYDYFAISNKCTYGNGYVGIIDCTMCDPYQYIKIRISKDIKREITVTAKKYAPCVEFTVSLLSDIYCGTKKMDEDLPNLKSRIIIEVDKVFLAASLLFNEVCGGQSEEKINRYKRNIIEYTLPSEPFSAFKRTYLEEEYNSAPAGRFKDILKEILSDSNLNPNIESTCTAT